MEGRINLSRKLQEWEWYTTPFMVQLWIHLLLKANYKDKRWRGVVVKRGQLVTSLSKLSEETKISVRSIRTVLAHLKETGEIDTLADKQFTLITICKYDEYQDMPTPTDKPTDKRPTNDRQTTDNNINKEKKEKENNIIDITKEKIDLEAVDATAVAPARKRAVAVPDLSFVDEKFKKVFEGWVSYRKEIKKPMTQTQLKLGYEKLMRLSSGDVEIAKKIIVQSEENGWQGLFPLDSNGHRVQPGTGYDINKHVNDIWDNDNWK